MVKKPKAKLEVVPPIDLTLTQKQRAFVDAVSRGKLGSHKAAYAQAYSVKLNKNGSVPKWVEVEASKLLASPKIALSLQRALQRKEHESVASALRIRNHVISRLYAESVEAESDASRVRALELLGKLDHVSLFSDKLEVREDSREPAEIEAEIHQRLAELLS